MQPKALCLCLAIVLGPSACDRSSPGHHGDGGSGDDLGTGEPGTDFPAAPVVDTTGGAPADAPTLFGPPGSGDGSAAPCVMEPQDGSLLPQNWLRPRFSVSAADQNLFEVRLHTASQVNDLVVYTSKNPWTIDKKYWDALREKGTNQPIVVTIRGAKYEGSKLTAGPSLAATATFTIAPVEAPGAIVYWTANKGSPVVTALRGFSLGEEGVKDVVTQAIKPTQPKCLGCHSSTPDGKFVAFSFTYDASNGDNAQIEFRSTDGLLSLPPANVVSTTTASTLLTRPYQQMPSFSSALWDQGDRTMISMLSLDSGNTYDIYWTDLANGLSDKLKHDEGAAKKCFPGAASFSHSGENVVYACGSNNATGYQMSDGQIYVVPFSKRAGGTATALAGASDAAKNQYYPSYSDDDKLIAFTRVDSTAESNLPNGVGNPQAEVFVIPAAGGTATRLAANDPAQCRSMKSPGLTNSWSKWAPTSKSAGGRTYYWLTFSSKRHELGTVNNPAQLYVTPIVLEGDGTLRTYPALYLWNQPGTEGNHTPAWVSFEIPIS